MIAMLRRWLKRRRNLRCALGHHIWKTEKARIPFTVTRCSNCGVSYLTIQPGEAS